MTRYQEGLTGERLAAVYLQQLGFTILTRRYRSRAGEVDLIARQDRMLYFVEVKYRPQGRLGSGLVAVTPDKRRRLKLTARHYLASQPSPYRLSCLEITRAGVWFRPDIMHEI